MTRAGKTIVRGGVFAGLLCAASLTATLNAAVAGAQAPPATTSGKPSTAPSTTPSTTMTATIAKVKQQIGDAAEVNAIQVEDHTLNIVVNDRSVSIDLYLTLVTRACGALGAEARQFNGIAFGNRYAEEGYLFKAPAKCAGLVKMPADQRAAAVLADTDEL